MKTKEIKYDVYSSFLGRNGYFKQSGIEIMDEDCSNEIVLSPITSKKQIGRAFLTLPKDKIPEFIKALKSMVETN